MTTSLSAAAGVVTLLTAAVLFQGRATAAQDRMQLLRDLDTHLGIALSHTSLLEKQARDLADARKVISGLASQRRLRDQYEREDLKQALKVVQSAFKPKKTFQEEERKAVLDDISKIKKSGLLSNPSPRRNTRMPRSPSPFPRNPRRW